MTSPYRELYQEVILDHGKRPRNHRALEDAVSAEGYNPLCGDKLTLYLKVRDGVVQDASFEGNGCAISTSSASMMTEALKGKTLEQTRALFDAFHGMVIGEPSSSWEDQLGKLAVFGGVREFPSRVKCATLAWHTMRGALEGNTETVTTE